LSPMPCLTNLNGAASDRRGRDHVRSIGAWRICRLPKVCREGTPGLLFPVESPLASNLASGLALLTRKISRKNHRQHEKFGLAYVGEPLSRVLDILFQNSRGSSSTTASFLLDVFTNVNGCGRTISVDGDLYPGVLLGISSGTDLWSRHGSAKTGSWSLNSLSTRVINPLCEYGRHPFRFSLLIRLAVKGFIPALNCCGQLSCSR